MTGPKIEAPPTEITGVPTSTPTRSMPSVCDARTASSYSVESIASARSAGRPASVERGLDRRPVPLGLLVVEPRADRRVERQHRVGAELLLRGDAHPDRAPRLGHPLLVALRQVVPALVEHREAHHVPAGRHRAYLRHLQHPAGGNPGPRAQRVEPEIDLHRRLIRHNISSARLTYAHPPPGKLTTRSNRHGIPPRGREIMPCGYPGPA